MTRAEQAKDLASEIKWAAEALEESATDLEKAKRKHWEKQLAHATAIENLRKLAEALPTGSKADGA